jgi:hypothetical protein
VAGGVLLADSIRGLFHGSGNPYGIGSGFGGGGVGGAGGGGDTLVTNYYGDESGAQQAGDFGTDYDRGSSDGPSVLDAGSDSDLGGGGDDTYDA